MQVLTDLCEIGDEIVFETTTIAKAAITDVQLRNDVSMLTALGDNFLTGAGSLTALDLSLLTELQRIGENFLNDCAAMMSVKFPLQLDAVNIGQTILQNAPADCVLSVPAAKVQDYQIRYPGRALYVFGY
jgi:hypothetical protein